MFWKVLEIVEKLDAEHGHFKNILDVGSRNINGSVKDVLVGYDKFIGVDMIAGEGVDIVMNAHDLLKKFHTKSFDLITCCETLEHDINFWKTINAMKIVLKPGGWLFISTTGINFFKHDFPSDYYRFTEEVFKDYFFKDYQNIYIENYVDSHSEYVNKPNNVMGYAQKPK